MEDILTYIYEQSCNNCIYGMGSTTIDDIKDYVQYQIENIINDNELDVDIIELYVHGSRINGNPHKDSDLDVVLYYKGSMKEDTLFNILHNDEYIETLTYDKVYIDINPIRDEETGSLDNYIKNDKIISNILISKISYQ